MVDILIKNATIVDGTGSAPWPGDLAVQGDRIAQLAPSLECEAAAVVDAGGKMVCPGLIDPHVHEEWVCFADGLYDLFLKQGVTTLVNGNCGHSILPGPVDEVVDYYFGNGLMSFSQRDRYREGFPRWTDFHGYRAAVEGKTNLNFVTLLGHGTIRERVMHGAHPRPPSQAEWAEIEAIIRAGMEQGLWGISYGLDYIPSRYADVEELARVSRLIAEYGGVSACHLRHYIGIPEAVAEFIEVGRKSGCRLQISHLKAACPEAFEVARRAIEQGVPALIDTIPRSTGHLMSKRRLIQFITAISSGLFDKGEQGVHDALATPEGRAMILRDAYIFAGDKEEIFIVNSEDPALENRSVAEIAGERGVAPEECMLDLIADDRRYTFWLGGPSRADFPDAGHVQSIVENPYVCVGSDRIMGDPEDPYDWYELQRIGSFPIFMQMYLEKGVAVQEIIRRNTSMLAEHFGIPQRGRLAPGYFADVAVVDLPNYRFPRPEKAHYRTPEMRATGVEQVLVNGAFALRDGETLPSYPGRVLQK